MEISDPPPVLAPTLKTPRLLLCPTTEQDIDELVQHYREPAVTRYERYTDLDHAGEILRWWGVANTVPDVPEGVSFTIRLPCENLVIGRCLINRLDGIAIPEIGFSLKPPFWGRGYATEAAAAAAGWAFDALNIPKLRAGAYAGNAACIRVLEKLGMRDEKPMHPWLIRWLKMTGHWDYTERWFRIDAATWGGGTPNASGCFERAASRNSRPS